MKKLLEIGSGQGFNASLLAKKNNNKVVGIDLSQEDVLISRKRYPHVRFENMNAEKMKFKNDYFDEIYALDVLEHVNNLNKVLNEISRTLKTNGKAFINIPHYKSEAWLTRIRPSYFKEIHHVRVFKENELDKLMLKRNLILGKKIKTGFLHHVELYFLFKRNVHSKTQLSIGSWRDNFFTKSLHAFMLYFEPMVLNTPLVYFPIWILTIPIGSVINSIGNLFYPKSFYYTFIKTQ